MAEIRFRPYGSISSRAGQAERLDYAGTGTRDDPVQFQYFHATNNFNAYATQHEVFANQTEIAVRIRRIWLELDGTDATALNATAVVAAIINSWAAGGAGTANPVHLTTTGAFVRPVAPYGDSRLWDFDPPLLLLRTAETNLNGAWDGNMTVQVIGYAATDDMTLYVEGEWWYL